MFQQWLSLSNESFTCCLSWQSGLSDHGFRHDRISAWRQSRHIPDRTGHVPRSVWLHGLRTHPGWLPTKHAACHVFVFFSRCQHCMCRPGDHRFVSIKRHYKVNQTVIFFHSKYVLKFQTNYFAVEGNTIIVGGPTPFEGVPMVFTPNGWGPIYTFDIMMSSTR